MSAHKILTFKKLLYSFFQERKNSVYNVTLKFPDFLKKEMNSRSHVIYNTCLYVCDIEISKSEMSSSITWNWWILELLVRFDVLIDTNDSATWKLDPVQEFKNIFETKGLTNKWVMNENLPNLNIKKPSFYHKLWFFYPVHLCNLML